jgi:hypothetical protein
MFDFLRDLRKSEEEKRQEALTAYLDGVLTPAERKRFERLLTSDEALRSSLEEQRLIRASLRRLPRMRAPRNFTLDPTAYGRPAPSTADRLYPVMRVATAVVAILFVVALVIDLAPLGQEASQPLTEGFRSASEVAEAPAAPEEEPVLEAEARPAAIDEVVVEVTRVVSEQEAAPALAAEELAGEEPEEADMMAEEEAMEEETVEDVIEAEAPLPGPEEASGGGGLPPEATPLAMVAPSTADRAAVATEGQALEEQPIVEPTQPLATATETETPAVARDMAMTEEAAEPATPGLVTRAVPTAEAAFAAADRGPAQEATGAGVPATQILAVGLGLLLLVLIGVTLLLRLRTG